MQNLSTQDLEYIKTRDAAIKQAEAEYPIKKAEADRAERSLPMMRVMGRDLEEKRKLLPNTPEAREAFNKEMEPFITVAMEAAKDGKNFITPAGAVDWDALKKEVAKIKSK